MTDGTDGTKPCVLLIEPIPSWIVDRARDVFDLIVLPHENERPPAFIDNVDRIHGIAMQGFAKVDAAMMALLPNLEIIACFGVGYDGADVDYARQHGIAVTNTPDVLTDCVADLGYGIDPGNFAQDCGGGSLCPGRAVGKRGDFGSGEFAAGPVLGYRRPGPYRLGAGETGRGVWHDRRPS